MSTPNFTKIVYRDGKLSITGVVGPLPNGNCIGSCGQIIMDYREYDHRGHMSIADIRPALGWTHAKIRQFFDVWDQWHLNDLQAGSPRQMAWLEAHKSEFPGYPANYYNWACTNLTLAGLHPDTSHPTPRHPDGYPYGSEWLTVEIPADVLQFLANLPDTDRKPAWV